MNRSAYNQLMRMKGSSNFVFLLLTIWRYYKWLWLPVAAITLTLVVRRLLQSPLGYWDLSLIVLLISPALPTVIFGYGPQYQYRRLEEQFAFGDFEAAWKSAEEIERKTAGKKLNILGPLATKMRTRILARSGKVPEAIALLDSLTDTISKEPSIYWRARAAIFDSANMHEESCECFKRLSEIQPQNYLGWLGMVEPLASSLNRPAEARAHFEHARALKMLEFQQWDLEYIEGLVLMAEADHQGAQSKFESFIPNLRISIIASPSLLAVRAMLLGNLAICAVKTGNAEEARTYFAEAEPLLRIHNSQPLLSRCEEAVRNSC